MLRKIKVWGVLMGILWLSGCAAKYSCSRFPSNHCENMSTVYAKTGANFVDYRQAGAVVDDTAPLVQTSTAATPVWQPAAPGAPVLTPDQVVRVWITPWQDRDGDLEADYVYVHVHTAAWTIIP